jgi:hypothetical protein
MPYEQAVDIGLADGVIIRYSWSGRPIARYAVVLLVLVDGVWEEVRLYDNHLDDHHMHRYTRSQGKQPPSRRSIPVRRMRPYLRLSSI